MNISSVRRKTKIFMVKGERKQVWIKETWNINNKFAHKIPPLLNPLNISLKIKKKHDNEWLLLCFVEKIAFFRYLSPSFSAYWGEWLVFARLTMRMWLLGLLEKLSFQGPKMINEVSNEVNRRLKHLISAHVRRIAQSTNHDALLSCSYS